MTELLEERGIKICITPLPESVSGMTCLVKRTGDLPPVPVIVVNRHHTLERRRLTLAHELAHRLIHETSPIDHEKAAYFFAGAFLIPQAHLVREIGKHRNALDYYELVQLKLMYRVRAAALLVRLKDIGVIDASTLTYAFQTFAKSWRREEPAPLEALGQEGTHEPTRRFERLCYWALAEQLISLSKASELLQRPLRRVEMDMKGPTGEDAHYCQ